MNRFVCGTAIAIALGAGPRGARAQTAPVAQEVARLLSSSNGGPGTLEGHPAVFRVDKVGRYQNQSNSVLRITIPTPTLRLQVRRHDASGAHEKSIDVQLGDPPFDDKYLVEGAPSDLVRALLDEPLRRALLDCERAVLDIDGSFVEVIEGGTVATPDEARRFIAIGALVARRLGDGLAAPAGAALSPEQQAAELAQLQSLRERRQRNAIVSVIPAALIGFLFIGALIWNLRRRQRRA